MIQIKQLIPESMCLSCDGCCRYAERDTVWAPLFLFEEIIELTEKNILPSCLFVHHDVHGKKATRINLIESQDGWICPCLDMESNKCKIYFHRPFDCRLYPFLLARKGDEAFLAVDEKCPFTCEILKTQMAKEYIRTLAKFLRSPDFLPLAKNNPEIVQSYAEDVKFLAVLPELSASLYGTSA